MGWLIGGIVAAVLLKMTQAQQSCQYNSNKTQASLSTGVMTAKSRRRVTGAAPMGQPTTAGADGPYTSQKINPQTPQMNTDRSYASPPTAVFTDDNGQLAHLAVADATQVTWYDTNGDALVVNDIGPGQSTTGIGYSKTRQLGSAVVSGPGGSVTVENPFVTVPQDQNFSADGVSFQDENSAYPDAVDTSGSLTLETLSQPPDFYTIQEQKAKYNADGAAAAAVNGTQFIFAP